MVTRLPYPGLRPFRRDESDLFFGREGSVDVLVDKLAATRFLAVLGSSGSGKSSLVRTGLLDALELGLSPRMGSSWRLADMRPGERPMRSLAAALLQGAGAEVDAELLADFLARGPRSLVTWCADGNLPAGANLLLLVDQFEELFRFDQYAGREEAEAFVALLLQSASERDSRIHVVITMRSEFLGSCALLPGLAERINEGMYLTSRMTRDQCREAIEGPAAVIGFRLEPALVNRLLNDLSDFAPWEDPADGNQLARISRRADQLPLMQHVLNRLWLRSDQGAAVVLRLADYEAIGGLGGALDEHGAEILRTLGPGRESQVEAVFRALVTGSSLANAVRRPAPFEELVAVCGGDASAARRIVDEFRSDQCNFLQPPPGVALEPSTIVDITHESLIRQWRVLATWLLAEAKAAGHWEQLAQGAHRHAAGQADLLHGLDLANASAWWDEEAPTPEWAARYGGQFAQTRAYLQDSRAQAKAAARSRRTLRMSLWGLSLLLLGAVVFGLVQSRQSNARLEGLNAQLTGNLEESKRQRDVIAEQANALSRKNEEQQAANVTLTRKQQELDAQYDKLALANGELQRSKQDALARNSELTRLNQRMSVFGDTIEIAEKIKATGFSRDPKVSSDVMGVALSGYDPVSYFKPGGPTLGQAKHYALHRGAIWLFDSAQNKAAFDQQPERYMPAFGGFCTPCLASKHVVHGRPLFWHEHEGKVYLASTRELIEAFKKKPKTYVDLASPFYNEAPSAWDSAPNVRTAFGDLLGGHIVLLNAPDAYRVFEQLAQEYARGRLWSGAVTQQQAAIDRLLKLPPDDVHRAELPRAFQTLAGYQLSADASELPSAERAAREGLRLAPQSLELQALLAQALLLQGGPAQEDEAMEIYRRNLGKPVPGRHFWEEDVVAALDAWEQGHQKHPRIDAVRTAMQTPLNYPWLKSRAAALQAKQDWAEAAKAQTAVLEYLNRADPVATTRSDDLPSAYLLMSWYKILSKDFDGGVAATDAGLKKSPDAAELKINKANALLLLGRTQEATAIYDARRGLVGPPEEVWEAKVAKALKTLESYGATHPEFARIRASMQVSAEYANLNATAERQSEAKSWPQALAAQRAVVDFLVALPATDSLRSKLAGEYTSLSWYQIFNRDYAGALDSTDKGLALDPRSLSLQVNRAHAFLLLDRVAEAEALHAANRGMQFGDKSTWNESILQDLKDLEAAGITHPRFEQVRAMLR